MLSNAATSCLRQGRRPRLSAPPKLFHLLILVLVLPALGANYRTRNFSVQASTFEIARQVAHKAEQYRRDLAVDWLGQAMPDWETPCQLNVEVGSHRGVGGMTTFRFNERNAYAWRINIHGPWDRLMDSVLPHEITHTIFATHFGTALPRWIDEGVSISVEHEDERNKQQQILVRTLRAGRGISLQRMFAMNEYPPDLIPLYSQGYSLTNFLVGQGGKQKFVEYIHDGLKSNDWPAATEKHYGYANLGDLQIHWLNSLMPGGEQLLALEQAR